MRNMLTWYNRFRWHRGVYYLASPWLHNNVWFFRWWVAVARKLTGLGVSRHSRLLIRVGRTMLNNRFISWMGC